MAELKEQLEGVRNELANSKSLSDSLKQELEQVREGGREREREREIKCIVHVCAPSAYTCIFYTIQNVMP